MRKVCYVSGTRADFGLMESTLKAIQVHPALELSIVATGMHLLPQFGSTVADIEAAGFPVSESVHVDMQPANGATMARNIGRMLTSFVDAFESIRPDVVLLLGDRGEMLAGALAAIHLNIPVAHIHGGERSGTVDEPIRHAISKLSHLHFTATSDAATRLTRMGERGDHVWVTGAPGLDGLTSLAHIDRPGLLAEAGFCGDAPVAMLVYHPVLQEAETAGSDTEMLLDALLEQGLQIVALMPNSDAGSDGVRDVLEKHRGDPRIYLSTHFRRERFVSWMASVDLMIGNSSAGIIEAASFGTPVINIGSRQGPRERNSNVRDVSAHKEAVRSAITAVLSGGRFASENIYGDGQTAKRIAGLLADISLDQNVMMKTNAY